jgi:hypothetical protein
LIWRSNSTARNTSVPVELGERIEVERRGQQLRGELGSATTAAMERHQLGDHHQVCETTAATRRSQAVCVRRLREAGESVDAMTCSRDGVTGSARSTGDLEWPLGRVHGRRRRRSRVRMVEDPGRRPRRPVREKTRTEKTRTTLIARNG